MMATTTTSASNSTGSDTRQSKGNLHSLLKAYDQSHDNSSIGGTTLLDTNQGSSDSISLQLDHLGRERSSTLGSIRERGLTFGSEFDFGLGLTNENDAVSSHDAVFDLSAVNGQKLNVVSAGNSNASNIMPTDQHQQQQQQQVPQLQQVPQQHEHQTAALDLARMQMQSSSVTTAQLVPSRDNHLHFNSSNNNTANNTANMNVNMNINNDNMNNNNSNMNNANGSINNINMNNISKMFSNINSNHQDNQSEGGQYLHGHTPPSAIATSYENKHFGKRVRSGSLSGRLRSMSDLEDRGIIDSNQKGILKDLIISGDDELNQAVEKYEKGDTKALESMLKNGALRARHASDIDILGDLDLDFLSMNEDFGGGGVGGDDSVMSGVAATMSASTSKPLAIPMRTRRRSLSDTSNTFMQHSNHGSDTSNSLRESSPGPVHTYDGIVDLDFNADYAPSSSSSHINTVNTVNTNIISNGNEMNEAGKITIPIPTKPRSDSMFDIQRNRANSLAFGSLLDETPEEVESIGKWMDRTPVVSETRAKMPFKKRVSSHIVGANGDLYIINNPTKSTTTRKQTQKTNNPLKMEKLDAAETRRREREAKKALKEREKMQRKMQREREKLEKKERDAREKKAGRKNKKGDSSRKKKADIVDDGDAEEPKVILSGTGRPRSLSDPNLTVGIDANGLMQIDHPPDWVGAYSPESRKIRIDRFLAKRNHRVWVKKVKYDVRKNFADSRLRVKGRFVKKADELLMRDLMSLT